jgi:hypothetical protein
MHIVVEPQYTVRMYDTGLMLMTVQAIGVLTYRWYLLIYLSYSSGGGGNVGDVVVDDIGAVVGAGTGACDRHLEC